MGDQFWTTIPAEFLEKTPSRANGISLELERSYRNKSTWFIENLGMELKCDRYVISTACVFFNRFYVFQSFSEHPRFVTCATCLFLACKVDDSPRRLTDIVTAYRIVRGRFNADADTHGMLEKILVCERILLQTLCFDLQVTHPYNLCALKIQDIKNYIPTDRRKEFKQSAVNFLNDSFRTTLGLQFPPSHLVAAVLFMTTLQLSLPPIATATIQGYSRAGSEQSWFELLSADCDPKTMREICTQLLHVYNRSDNIPSIVTEQDQELLKFKMRAAISDDVIASSRVKPAARPAPPVAVDESVSAVKPSHAAPPVVAAPNGATGAKVVGVEVAPPAATARSAPAVVSGTVSEDDEDEPPPPPPDTPQATVTYNDGEGEGSGSTSPPPPPPESPQSEFVPPAAATSVVSGSSNSGNSRSLGPASTGSTGVFLPATAPLQWVPVASSMHVGLDSSELPAKRPRLSPSPTAVN